MEEVLTTAIRKAHLHPHMLVAVYGDDGGFLAAALAPRVRKVIRLGSPAEEEPAPQSADALFASLDLPHASDLPSVINTLLTPLKPGGRLVMVFAQCAPGHVPSQILAWLAQSGLVNCLVFPLPQPAPSASTAATPLHTFVAVGARPVAGVESAVRENYAALAEGQGSCCAPAPSGASCCSGDSLISLDSLTQSPGTLDQIFQPDYSAADRQQIPAQVAEFSLGCGNPTAFAALQPGEVVVDIGSGGGLDALIAARQVGPQGKVIGVDMTPAMLDRARRAAASAGLPNVEFRQGQADTLPVDNASVDVIISNCVINLTPDKGRVFQEAYRLLRPGGRLEVSDIVTDIAFLPDLLTSGSDWSGCVTGALPEEEYLDLIQAAGFSQVQVRRSQPGLVNGVSVYSAQVSARK
ncbi:MAG TPA: arsenite methyltransferase [Anaerolineales bacterium]|nr:arsenite methyltransferase [Anaerolineales bacterium]